MKYRVFNIDYDLSDLSKKEKREVIAQLSEELTFEIDDPEFDPECDLADKISDQTGWCVNSFDFAIVK